MKLPIVAYGDPVLKKVCADIDEKYPDLQTLIKNMFETMYHASGVGLAAPQVGLPIRLFIVDTKGDEEEAAYVKVFINAQILEETGEPWAFNEGCLSIPDVREDVYRHEKITIEYFDENFTKHTDVYDGLIARVIQHEYDHIEGVLFTDKISSLKKTLIKKKLQNIMDGKARPDYRMRFAGPKKGR